MLEDYSSKVFYIVWVDISRSTYVHSNREYTPNTSRLKAYIRRPISNICSSFHSITADPGSSVIGPNDMQIEKCTLPTSPHNHRFHVRDKWHLFIKRLMKAARLAPRSKFATFRSSFVTPNNSFCFWGTMPSSKSLFRRDVTIPYKAYSRLEVAGPINICRVARSRKK